ncbi:MAG: glycosyltransferase family 39 protein [Deltaproteobacteria bacterium]|nr:glycosyltransferase family 39 protein [Deltaproteobacteria bacterium]
MQKGLFDRELSHSLLLILLFFVIVVTIAIRIPSISIPLERDEGEYAYIAWAITQGDVPYKDIFDQKPPIIFYIYLLFLKIGNWNIEAIRVGMIIFTLFTMVFLFFLMKYLFDDISAVFGLASFGIMTIEPSVLGQFANTEIFTILPMVISIWIMVRWGASKRLYPSFFSGLMIGIAFMIKQISITIIPFLLIYIIIFNKKRETLIYKLALVIFGSILPLAFFELYFYYKGSLKDFAYAVFLHNISYSFTFTLKEMIIRFWLIFKIILKADFFIWFLALIAIIYLLKEKMFKQLFLLIAFFIFSFLGVCIGGYFRPHYFIFLFPALACLSGVGAKFIIEKLPKKSEKIAIFILLIIIFAFPLLFYKDYLFTTSGDVICRKIFKGTNPFVEAKHIAKYIAFNSEPNERVYIIGSEPEILFYAKRKSATKYIIFYPLTYPYPDTFFKQQKVFREVKENHPKHIVFVNMKKTLLLQKGAPTYIFYESTKWINEEYLLVGAIYVKENSAKFFWDDELKKLSFQKRKKAQILVFKRRD